MGQSCAEPCPDRFVVHPDRQRRIAVAPTEHPALSIFEKLTEGESCVLYDPTQQNWRNVSARVEGDGGTFSIRMTELFVRPALADLGKAEMLQYRGDLARLEYRRLCHDSGESDSLSADKLSFKQGLSIFQEHFHHFAKVCVELIQRVGLGVGSRESGDVTHVEASLRVLFDDCRVFFHGTETSSLDLSRTESFRGEPP